MNKAALLVASSFLLALAAALVACSGDDDHAGSAFAPDASLATDAASDSAAHTSDAAADAGRCPDGGQVAYGESYCYFVEDSVVTPSTTRLELRTLNPVPDAGVSTDAGDGGGCTAENVDLTFDVTGQSASISSCNETSDGGFASSNQTLALTPAQTTAMLAAWTEIRMVATDGGAISCGYTLAEYPAAVTRTDATGTTTLDTCSGSTSSFFDDFKAFNDILAFFQRDGGS